MIKPLKAQFASHLKYRSTSPNDAEIAGFAFRAERKAIAARRKALEAVLAAERATLNSLALTALKRKMVRVPLFSNRRRILVALPN